jgi:O-antigen/teichoic acid export membrane protein
MEEKEEVASVARKSTFILGVKLAITLASYVGFLFVARLMGVEAWGIIGFAIGLVGIFYQTDFGFAVAHNKMISEGRNIEECIGAYVLIKSVLISVSAVILLGGLFVWENLLGYGYQNPIQKDVVMVIFIYFIMFSITQIPVQTFGGLRQSVKQQTPELVGTLARVPVMIYVALASLGIIALAYSYVVTGLVMVFLALLLFRKHRAKSPSRRVIKGYLFFAAPISLYLILSSISLNIDKVAIQLFWDSVEVGYFFGMQRVTLIMNVIAMALLPILLPSISYYYTKKRKRTVRQLLFSSERYISMILVPLVVVCCVLPAPLIHIMVGDEFLPATNVLAILALSALFLSLNVPHIQTLYGCGYSKAGARVGITIALTNTILIFIFVPRDILGFSLFGLGALGAALASLMSVCVGFVISRHYTKRILKTRFRKRIVRHWLAGIGSGLLLYQLSIWFSITRWYEFAFFSVIGLLVYLGLLIALKEFRRKDLHFFLEILNPRKMKDYVRQEMKE